VAGKDVDKDQVFHTMKITEAVMMKIVREDLPDSFWANTHMDDEQIKKLFPALIYRSGERSARCSCSCRNLQRFPRGGSRCCERRAGPGEVHALAGENGAASRP